MKRWASVFTLTFGNTQNGTVVSSARRPQFTPKVIPWYSFLLKA